MGSITVRLISSLSALNSVALRINNRFTCLVEPNPVKHEVNRTVTLPLTK